MIQDLIILNAIILNSPPYSPDYNPIEETFAIIHNKLKLITNKRNLISMVLEILREIPKRTIINFFLHSFEVMISTLEKKISEDNAAD